MVAHILSPAQRAALFDPPSDPAAIERLYKLGPDDLIEVFRRRRAANRIGYAVQLGYLRHPSRAIEPGEVPPAAMLAVLAAQTGCAPDAFADYTQTSRGSMTEQHGRPIMKAARVYARAGQQAVGDAGRAHSEGRAQADEYPGILIPPRYARRSIAGIDGI